MPKFGHRDLTDVAKDFVLRDVSSDFITTVFLPFSHGQGRNPNSFNEMIINFLSLLFSYDTTAIVREMLLPSISQLINDSKLIDK